MASSVINIPLANIIMAILARQPVLNQDDISPSQLQTVVNGIGSLDCATSNQVSFLTDEAYASILSEARAAVIIVSDKYVNEVPSHSIAVVVKSPYVAYASVSHLFDPLSTNAAINPTSKDQSQDKVHTASNSLTSHALIHETAQIADTAVLGDNVQVGAFCVIGDYVEVGAGTKLHAHVHIEEYAHIGKGCVIYPHVYVGHRSQIGDAVRIHTGASIGSEGFGFAPLSDTASQGWERIVQLGRVVIGNGVRIGSNTCIDRGAIDDTVIEDNVIIDNLVQVGHNVKIGAGSAIAGNAGIAGSAIIGKRCMIGGGVGIAGHLKITDDVVLTGMTMVSRSINKPGVYSSGVTSMPAMDWRRVMVKLRAMGKKDT